MVVFAHGEGLAVFFTANEAIREYIADCCWTMVDEGTYHVDCDHKGRVGDGVFVLDMDWECVSGASSYTGEPAEYAIEFTTCRLATKEEWVAHLHSEWPWEPKADRQEKDHAGIDSGEHQKEPT